MNIKRQAPAVLFALVLCGTLALSATCFAASGQILHAFNTLSGTFPCVLTQDSAGNLYGTTSMGGTYNAGTLFMLSPTSGATWKFTLLHIFGTFDSDGLQPIGGVTFDAAGNLYGTTTRGGYYGQGTIYQLSPSGGRWTYKVLRGFTGRNGEGNASDSTPTIDAAGNLYGTTVSGGAFDDGAVWELSPQSDGTWKESILYEFQGGNLTQTAYNVIFGPDGNLFGVGVVSGTNKTGTVFELSPSAGGAWSETILHDFGPNGSGDGWVPTGISFDTSGNIFGLTYLGGSHNDGTLFEIPRNGDGTWGPEVIIHNFTGGKDGIWPQGSPVFAASGDLFGVTAGGGLGGLGTLFKFSPSIGGTWTGTLLHNFAGGKDGESPAASPTLDPSGVVYGTTSGGGIYDAGTAWKITP